MSSKKRKSNGQLWYICDKCKCILQAKDTSLHKEHSCSVNGEILVHPYIKDDVLHIKTQTYKVEDFPSLKSLPLDRRNDFILVSVAALQLMKLPIGDPILICSNTKPGFTPFVKYAWPLDEKTLSVYFTKQVLAVNSLDLLDNLSLHPVQGNIYLAKNVVIQYRKESDIVHETDFMLKLKEQNIGNIYCVGNNISYSYYGKLLIFEVIDIQPVHQDEHEKENLKCDEPKLYNITQGTTWKILKDTDMNPRNTGAVKKIGGIDYVIKELEEIVQLALSNGKSLSVTGIHITRGVLIFGPHGTGKTSLVEFLAGKFEVNIVKVETSQIYSKYTGEAEKQLVSIFNKAKQLSPSIILIDEIDVISSSKLAKTSDQEKRITSTLSLLLDRLHADGHSILVFATTSKINDVHKSLRRPGRFGKEVEIHVPDSTQRKEILKISLENVTHSLEEKDFKEIGDLSHGFVGADLMSLTSKAILRQYKSNRNNKVSLEDFLWALTKVKPSAMREVSIEIPNVKWCDIGGQEELKLKLKQAVEWPLKYEDSFRRLGIAPPRGLLMFGPPGCSKTMIAKALATESSLNFLSVKGPELFSKWVGESEKAVREIFRRARQVAPSIVFFDELDAIGGERNNSGGGSNVEERVLAQLLTELDGVEPLGNVTIVGATNRLDRIDPALLRPGRFDRIVYVPLPDADTRRQIFKIQFKKTPIGEDVNLEELVLKTDGYSGAEIVAVCHEAALKALEEDLNSNSVLRKYFLIALDVIIPRTPQSLLEIYNNFLNK